MDFKFNMPTELYFGRRSLVDNYEKMKKGKKALIATGKSGARVCKAEGADFIIAIGGGSPMDAAKAIAALAVNDMGAKDLIGGTLQNKPLPVIAVPTTSGTGSEVTPYSILTVPGKRTKMNFHSHYSFPVIAFADPAYTMSMPRDVTIDTAFDAFSHLLESYLSKKSTPLNDALAIEGIRAWSECAGKIKTGDMGYGTREKLMYASTIGGMAITHTGTTIIHAMGYSLTFFKGIPHGRANAMLIGEYLKYNYDLCKDKVDRVLEIAGFENIGEAAEFFKSGTGERLILDEGECRTYARLAAKQGSVESNPKLTDEADMYRIFKTVFGGMS